MDYVQASRRVNAYNIIIKSGNEFLIVENIYLDKTIFFMPMYAKSFLR